MKIALIILLFFSVVYLPGLLRLNRLYSTLRFYRQQAPQLTKQNSLLREEIANLKTGPFYTEKLAREELGLIREGEWVIEMKNDDD